MFALVSVILDRLTPRRATESARRGAGPNVAPNVARERTYVGACPATDAEAGPDALHPALAGPVPDGLPDFRRGGAPRPWNAPPRDPTTPNDILDSPESLGDFVERSAWLRPHPRNRNRGRA